MSTAWPLTPLGEVLVQHREYIEVLEPRDYPKLSVKLYGRGVELDSPVDGASVKMKLHQIAKSGQVIVSEIWAKKGAIGLVPDEGTGALCTSHFFLFDVNEDRIHRGWLQALFRANYLGARFDEEAKGTTTYAAIRPKHFLAADIPLPPLAEQRRIVVKIERLAAKLDDARGIGGRSGREVELLKAALEHRIWPAETVGKGVPLAEITTFLARGRQSEQGPSDHYLIKSQHVQMGYCRPSDLTLSPFAASSVRPEAMLRKGDILIACSAAGCLGRVATYNRSDVKASTDTHVAIARANTKHVLADYLFVYLHGAVGQEQLRSRERGALKNERVGFRLAELNLHDLKQVPVPLPELSEQRRILDYLGGLQAKVDRLKALQAQTRAELDALLPSILDRAFKGEL